MKKISTLVLAAFAVVAAASCAKEFAPEQAQPEAVDGLVPVTFSISMDAAKSALADDLKVNFENGDYVAVYDGVAEIPNKFIVEGANGASAYISGTVSEGATAFTVVYPFTAAASLAEGVLTVTVPATQTIPAGKNIDPAALVSVGQAAKGEAIALSNVVSLMKFSISGSDVKSLAIKGNASEKIVGNLAVTLASGEGAAAGSGTLTVKPEGEDASFAAGTYYAAAVPAEIASGFAAMAIKAEGKAYKVSDKAASLVRNAGLNLGVMDATAFPDEITTKDQLLAFARLSGFLGIDDTVKIGADIDMESASWPLPKFVGNFDGQNHRIYNFIAASNGVQINTGFLETFGNGSDGRTFKNLCIGSKDYDFETKTGTYDGVSKIIFDAPATTPGTYKYPGLIAYCHANSTVENVVNFMNIEVTPGCGCKHRNGGVCGTMKAGVTVKDCINFGNIVDNSNITNVDAQGLYAIGGISGCFDGADCSATGCVNYGSITSNASCVDYLGGIIGHIGYAGTITGCTNKGAITYSGAALGYGASSKQPTLDIGGVVGLFKGAVTMTDCKNEGLVSIIAQEGTRPSTMYIGGVCGRIVDNVCVLDNCDNTADVTFDPNGVAIISSVELGGISPYCNKTGSVIKNCDSAANLKIKDGASSNIVDYGGILGRNVSGAATIENCTVSGTMYCGLSSSNTSDNFESVAMGGIMGRTHQATAVNNCSCTADLTFAAHAEDAKVGGIVGYAGGDCTLTNVSYSGTITGNETEGGKLSCYAGAIARNKGKANKVNGCTVNAVIDIKSAPAGKTYVGGLHGYWLATTASTQKAIDVSATIIGAEVGNAGMLLGMFDSSSTQKITFGVAGTDPVKVAGSLNGIAAAATNYVGTASASNEKIVINAE